MHTLRSYLCPLAVLASVAALAISLLRNTAPAEVIPAGVQEAPIIRLLDIGERSTDHAWRDDFIEATISDPALWIDRPAAQPWRDELVKSARQANLSPAFLAEVIGMESGFRNVRNPASTAFGFGQQLAGNQIMRACRLDRAVPAQSILGAALELRWDLDRQGSIEKAVDAYGTTTRLSVDLRARVFARMRMAAQRL